MHGDRAPQTSERLGLEWLGEIGLPPTDLVLLAADAGCRHISTILERIDLNPYGYPAWSLLDDAALRREMKARMLDRGISISLGEGCVIRPDADVSDHKAHSTFSGNSKPLASILFRSIRTINEHSTSSASLQR